MKRVLNEFNTHIHTAQRESEREREVGLVLSRHLYFFLHLGILLSISSVKFSEEKTR